MIEKDRINVELKNSLSVLLNSRILVYPTDTVWGIGCDATNEEAVQKVFKIKKRPNSKSLILLVNGLKMLQTYVSISNDVKELLKNSNRPTTVIYSNAKNLADSCIAEDNTVAIRIVKDEFCKNLIHAFGKPIVSTSANVSGQPTPKSFNEIEPAILDNVDYSVNLHRNKISNVPSRILKVDLDGNITTIRD